MNPQPLESLIKDPVVQFVFFVIVLIGVIDAVKFLSLWVWKKVGRKNED